MTQLELDPQFTQGLRLLYSTNKDSAEQLRALLDEAIKQKYGPSKMLSNVLHKKYMMEEPVLSDHSSSSSKKSKSSSSSKHSNKSSKNSSPVNLPARDTPPDILQSDDTLALEILEDDLTCVICKGMDVGARNRLVECQECHSLYHQECHVPHILDSQIDNVPKQVWYCSNCSKSQVSKERSSPKTVTESKSKEQKKPSSSSGAKMTPNIHIISADRRLKDMMKKAKQDKRNTSTATSSKNSSSSSPALSSAKSSQDKSGLLYKIKSGVE
ncbi:Integrator complex subunit 12 [Trachymyrmex zeteki]|uniref:Integrator complex subunit 12 n=1 Tax=Mycetomoellerius zeteki TaxID=64791 RepID=A0A151WMC7_9HYME|nr:PREDICTED: integrator complex subunit 12 [Trachymyrmex zeteki]XP_018312731.1 PREDICTED: integrator complex subunit 12 [Trachymyrmex zeteki]XP_018312732.1 PREDICTED: integrator complex subunit 12 [Trachymyrmex zeteki]XP_018312733.1 PREDICTED: integrator complex subunit 12 [Trachymyrmex zeteki]XP_018312734.1 PREDICTED: integrator complex subunit 12 [Trachymyrmex zeteki]XP_018312735.1 PREDICTED: integrator complex subunit 12 [Trachymyrmex zeteki]KYQ48993.1 Integrator complex subunit 12 [Trach